MATIKLRRAATPSAADASAAILALGEPGCVISTGEIRVGNGVDLWSNLPATQNNVVTFGADPTGVTSSKVAIEAAVAAAPEGGTIYFPDGIYTWSGDITVTTPRLTFTGPGIIRGRFQVGSGLARLELRCRFQNLRFITPLDKTTYPSAGPGIGAKGYAEGSYYIGIDRVREVVIQDCEFYGAAWPVYVKPNVTSALHDNAMIRVIGNRFDECDWAMYALTDLTSPGSWLSLSDSFFNANIVNRSYIGMLYLQGTDGFTCNGNVAFMVPFNQTTNWRFVEKMQNIRIDYSSFVHIHDNNLFECGTEGIFLDNARVTSITGNHIAWPGERVASDGIKIIAAAEADWATIAIVGNTIQYYTKSAVSLAGTFAEIGLGSNTVRYVATSDYYVGDLTGIAGSATHLPALSGVSHYRYEMSGVTGMAAADISVADSAYTKAGHYDLFPNHGYLNSLRRLNAWGMEGGGFRGLVTFTALTPISLLPLHAADESQTTYQGEVLVVARFGFTATAKTSVYKLLISRQASGAYGVTDVAKHGYLTGAAADEPSFAWTISSNTLNATPVGLTAGAFAFSYTFTGNLLVG